jgi:hypothetical protein
MSSNDDDGGEEMEASSESTGSSSAPDSASQESSNSQDISGNDSDVMITDEIKPKVRQNNNSNKMSVVKLNRKHSTSTNSIKEEDTSNGVQQTEDTKVPNDKPPSAQPLSKKDKKKSKAEKRCWSWCVGLGQQLVI